MPFALRASQTSAEVICVAALCPVMRVHCMRDRTERTMRCISNTWYQKKHFRLTFFSIFTTQNTNGGQKLFYMQL